MVGNTVGAGGSFILVLFIRIEGGIIGDIGVGVENIGGRDGVVG